MDSLPLAARWARTFARGTDASVDGYLRRGEPHAVRVTVPGIAEACMPDPDERLYELLVS